jgi:hypothetical protein
VAANWIEESAVTGSQPESLPVLACAAPKTINEKIKVAQQKSTSRRVGWIIDIFKGKKMLPRL